VQSALTGALDADSPRLTTNVAISSGHAANDNALWLGSDGGEDGIFGREPSAAVLPDGKTVVAWIGEDNIVHAALHPDEQKQQAEAAAGDTLSQMLASLGEAAPAQGRDGGRLKVQIVAPSSFAVVWLAELGAAASLAGKLFTLNADANEDGLTYVGRPEATWSVASISPAPVRGADASEISIVARDDGGLSLGYVSSDQSGLRVSHSVGVDLRSEIGHTEETHQPAHSEGYLTNDVTAHGHHDAGHAATAELSHEPAAEHSAAHVHGSSHLVDTAKHAEMATVASVSQLLADGADPHALALRFQNVAVTDDARVHVLELDHGSASGTAALTISTLDASGNPVLDAGGHPQVIEVTPSAVVNDPAHPEVDASPAATAIGNAVGVAWVQHSSAHVGATEVALQIYDSTGHAVAPTPAVVGVSSGTGGSVSDIDIAGLSHAADAPHDAVATAPAVADVAVTWVENADSQGYGTVKLQLLDVQHCAGSGGVGDAQAIRGLGADAQPGGDDDQAFAVTHDDATAIGRDPQVEGVRGGAIAVAWISPAASPTQSPVVTGVVIDGHNGHQLIALNLTVFMSHGVADDYAPQLFTSPNGDIVVGWVEHSGLGYDAQAAIYNYVSDGSWSSPTAALHLAHFDNAPDNLSINLVGNADPHLVVTWSDDGQSGRISLDVNEGQISSASIGSVCNGGLNVEAHAAQDSPAASADALASAQFVVVYAQGDHSAPDLSAVAFSADGSSASASDLRQTVDNLPLDSTSAAAVSQAAAVAALTGRGRGGHGSGRYHASASQCARRVCASR
jgi:hypothetical protein